jgi:Tfp pilus assembly protein PilZ
MRIKSSALIYKILSKNSLDAVKIDKAQIINLSKTDILFESNMPFNIGDDFYISFKIREYKEYLKRMPAKITWCNKLRDSIFKFGYVAKYFYYENSVLQLSKQENSMKDRLSSREMLNSRDPRDHPREVCNTKITLSYENKEYQGIALNISKSGVYIKSSNIYSLDQPIAIINGDSELGKAQKLSGAVVRLNKGGIGIKFSQMTERRSGKERRCDLDRRSGKDRRSKKM